MCLVTVWMTVVGVCCCAVVSVKCWRPAPLAGQQPTDRRPVYRECHHVEPIQSLSVDHWSIGTSHGVHPEWVQGQEDYQNKVKSSVSNYTVNRKKHTPECFWIYSLQNLTNCDKIWYILSCVNLSYRNVNVFLLTWIVSLLYLVKLGIRILQVNSS